METREFAVNRAKVGIYKLARTSVREETSRRTMSTVVDALVGRWKDYCTRTCRRMCAIDLPTGYSAVNA